MRLILIVFVILGPIGLYAQALNTTILSNWDDNSLRTGPLGNVFNDIWGYAADGREYAIMGSSEHTHFIDITDPSSPIEVSRIAGGSRCTWRDFKTYGHYAYGVADNCDAGLEIFDLSALPNSVTKVYDSKTHMTDVHNIFIDTLLGKLYATGITNGSEDIVVMDLTVTPQHPTVLKNLSLDNGYVHDLYVRHDTAYCSHIYRRQLNIYDFSDLDNIRSIGQMNSPGANHSNWISQDGKTMVVADETRNAPVLVVDIANLETPRVVSTFQSTLLGPTGSVAHNPFIIGDDFVVLSYYDDGLQIYKIDDPANPVLAGYYDTHASGTTYNFNGAWGAYPYLPSGHLIASDQDNGLYVIKATFPLLDCQKDVEISGQYDQKWTTISRDHIRTTAAYMSTSDLAFIAPKHIIVDQGFELHLGGKLTVMIENQCTVSNKRGGSKKVFMPNR